MMKFLTLLISLSILLTSCGSGIPQTADDVRSFEDVLAFMTRNAETEITEVILNVESAISTGNPVTLTADDASQLAVMLADQPVSMKRYEPEHIYGGSWYTVTLTLSDGRSVVLYPNKDELMVYRQELNEEERWYSAPYRVNTDAYPGFYTAVGEIWSQVSDEDPATH